MNLGNFTQKEAVITAQQMATDLSHSQVEPCLLYTSPSPRDRG